MVPVRNGVCSCVFWEKKNEHPGTVFFMLAYYSSVPFVLANLFAFSMQSLQNWLAALLTAFAVLLTEKYIEERGKKKLAGIVVYTRMPAICSELRRIIILQYIWR